MRSCVSAPSTCCHARRFRRARSSEQLPGSPRPHALFSFRLDLAIAQRLATGFSSSQQSTYGARSGQTFHFPLSEAGGDRVRVPLGLVAPAVVASTPAGESFARSPEHGRSPVAKASTSSWLTSSRAPNWTVSIGEEGQPHSMTSTHRLCPGNYVTVPGRQQRSPCLLSVTSKAASFQTGPLADRVQATATNYNRCSARNPCTCSSCLS